VLSFCDIFRLYSIISTKILSLKCAEILKEVSVEKTCGRKRSLNYVCVRKLEKKLKKLTFKRRRFAVFRCAHTVVDDVGFPPCYFNWEELKWLQICEFLIEIICILFLKTTLFYNFMLRRKDIWLWIHFVGVWFITKNRIAYS
jgi:hypothetical protein